MFCPVQYIMFFCEVHLSFFDCSFLLISFLFCRNKGTYCMYSTLWSCLFPLYPMCQYIHQNISPHADPWALNDTWGEKCLQMLFLMRYIHLPLILYFYLFILGCWQKALMLTDAAFVWSKIMLSVILNNDIICNLFKITDLFYIYFKMYSVSVIWRLKFQQPLLQSSVSHDPSGIIPNMLIWCSRKKYCYYQCWKCCTA